MRKLDILKPGGTALSIFSYFLTAIICLFFIGVLGYVLSAFGVDVISLGLVAAFLALIWWGFSRETY